MKKLVLVLAAMAASMFADTISISCTQVVISGNSGSSSSNCPGFSALPVGATANRVSIAYAFDFQYNALNNPAPSSVSYTIDGIGTILDINGSTSVRPVVAGAAGETNTAPFFSAFTVATSFGTAATYVTGATFDIQYTLDYSPAQTGVPEPSSMALMGGALVGIGALLRRRK